MGHSSSPVYLNSHGSRFGCSATGAPACVDAFAVAVLLLARLGIAFGVAAAPPLALLAAPPVGLLGLLFDLVPQALSC